METMNELAEIHGLLMGKNPFVTVNNVLGIEAYFLNSDLEEILKSENFSSDTVAHCRRFLDARKEWGFLYTGLPMDAISQANSQEIFSEDLLFMSAEDLRHWLEVCQKAQKLNLELSIQNKITA